MFEVLAQKEYVCQKAEHRNRRPEFHTINHPRAPVLFGERVIVPEVAKWALDHRILKMKWPVHLSNRNGHEEPQAKMLRSPLHLLSLIDQARCNAANSLFLRRGDRVHVKINASRKIKALCDRSFDRRLQENLRVPPLMNLCRPAGARSSLLATQAFRPGLGSFAPSALVAPRTAT